MKEELRTFIQQFARLVNELTGCKPNQAKLSSEEVNEFLLTHVCRPHRQFGHIRYAQYLELRAIYWELVKAYNSWPSAS
jgi:hypothetical protein